MLSIILISDNGPIRLYHNINTYSISYIEGYRLRMLKEKAVKIMDNCKNFAEVSENSFKDGCRCGRHNVCDCGRDRDCGRSRKELGRCVTETRFFSETTERFFPAQGRCN